MNYKLMIGVLPGDGYENEDLTPQKTIELGLESIARRLPKNLIKGCNVSIASDVYSKNFGCLEGGELGIQITGTLEKYEQTTEVVEAVKLMMSDLGQSTVTIEWGIDDERLGSSYISEGGAKIEEYVQKEELESFSVKIPADKIAFKDLGSRLQEAMDEVNGFRQDEDSKPMYMISGILTIGKDENGRKYYEYSGTQNPAYGQDDKELYQKSVVKTVSSVLEDLGNVVVEFNEFGVIVEEEMIRTRVRERLPEIEERPKEEQTRKHLNVYYDDIEMDR